MQVEPPSIKLIKSKNDDKSDIYFGKIKIFRDLASENSDPHGFKMTLFDNGEN